MERELIVSVKVSTKGEITVETNVAGIETALLLSEGASYVLQKYREEQMMSAKEAQPTEEGE